MKSIENKNIQQNSIQELNPEGANSVILVGGITEGIATLNRLSEALAQEDFRVISYDQTAEAATENIEGVVNVHHTAKTRQLIDIIDDTHRGEDDKATLLAHSQGSVFALNAALLRPNKVDRVVLYNPAGLFTDSVPKLVGRFSLEGVRKFVTPKVAAQRQQIEGVKRFINETGDFFGDAIDISRSSVEEQIKALKEKGIKVDVVLSNKDQVFPKRHTNKYVEGQDWSNETDFNSVSAPFSVKKSGKPHKLAGKYAGHDQPIIYPEQTANLISQIVRTQ